MMVVDVCGSTSYSDVLAVGGRGSFEVASDATHYMCFSNGSLQHCTTNFSLPCQKSPLSSFAALLVVISTVCPLLLTRNGYVTQSRCAFIGSPVPVPPKLHQASTYHSSQIAFAKHTLAIDIVHPLDRSAWHNTATDRTHNTAAAATLKTSSSTRPRSRTNPSLDTRHRSRPAMAHPRHKHIHNSTVQDSLLRE